MLEKKFKLCCIFLLCLIHGSRTSSIRRINRERRSYRIDQDSPYHFEGHQINSGDVRETFLGRISSANEGFRALYDLVKGGGIDQMQNDLWPQQYEYQDEASPRIGATGVNLTATDQSSPFRTAWTRQLREQAIINNIPKEVLNSVTRIIGWITLDLMLYGGNGIAKAFQDP